MLASRPPLIHGERHGTETRRWHHHDSFENIPWVNGERHGTEVRGDIDGNVTETPYVDGKPHGTEVSRDADGNVIEETRYVNGERQPNP